MKPKIFQYLDEAADWLNERKRHFPNSKLTITQLSHWFDARGERFYGGFAIGRPTNVDQTSFTGLINTVSRDVKKNMDIRS